ncbi:MAG: CinA family protein [Gammaproteobacteria bacterium]
MITDDDIEVLVVRVGRLLEARDMRVTVAESCTGGWIAKSLTDLPGSSAWFEHGFVTYGNNAKEAMLGVEPGSIEEFGAVSREVAVEMAIGARVVSGADLSVAVTGIAGPDGGTEDKPVGTVWFAWDGPERRSAMRVEHFAGDRSMVRRQAVAAALDGLLRQLADG